MRKTNNRNSKPHILLWLELAPNGRIVEMQPEKDVVDNEELGMDEPSCYDVPTIFPSKKAAQEFAEDANKSGGRYPYLLLPVPKLYAKEDWCG